MRTSYAAHVVVLHTTPAGEQRVLLTRRTTEPRRGSWALPGGDIDPAETARQAGVRALFEEAGIRVAADDLVQLGLYDAPGRDPRARCVANVFTVVADHAPEPILGDGSDRVEWTPTTRLPADLAFDHREILTDALRRDRRDRRDRARGRLRVQLAVLLRWLRPHTSRARTAHARSLRSLARAQAAVLALPAAQQQDHSPGWVMIAEIAQELAHLEWHAALHATEDETWLAVRDWLAIAEDAERHVTASFARRGGVPSGSTYWPLPLGERAALRDKAAFTMHRLEWRRRDPDGT